MGFRGKWTGFLGSVLLYAAGAVGQSSVTVVVNNSAHVEAAVLRKAETEATRLFSAAGITLRWLNCDQTDACRRSLLPTELVLHIVRNGKTQNDSVYGEAFLDEDGRGQYADVFFDRVRAAQANTDAGQLLGLVAAHELGHLLLGSRSHSQVGIMQPVWERDSVRKLGMGMLSFTANQARLMQQRVDLATRLQVRSLARSESEFGLLTDWPLGLRF